jgi:tight adherence protein C
MFETLNIETLAETARTYLTIRLGEISFGAVETSILVLSLVTAALSAFNLWRIAQFEDRLNRLGALRGASLNAAQSAPGRRPRWYNRLGSAVAASPIVGAAEQQRLLGVLARAGIKKSGDLATFIVSKVCGALSLGALSWLFVVWQQLFGGLALIRIGALIGGLMIGWRLPDFSLRRLASRRRLRLEQGLPDALDLLVICAEAGLSLDQAIEQVGRDLRVSNAAVAEEFATTAAEMRVLSDRGEALENLVKRTGLVSLRSITATLTQAIRFGTPLAESMRIIAAEMRTERLARIEARAARLPVFLAIPMMLFILPSLLMVIGTPVGIRIVDALDHVFSGPR